MTAPLVALLAALASQPSSTLVVFPPDPTMPDPETAWVGEAMADALPHALSRLGVSVVDRADRLRAQEVLEIPLVPLSRATAIRVAEALGADRLIVGSYSPGSMLRFSVRVLDVEHGTLSPPVVSEGPIERLRESIDSLARAIALGGSSPAAPSSETTDAQRASVPFEAFKAYGQGLSASNATHRTAFLHRALMLAPDFDDARLALGRLQLDQREFSAAHETLSRVGVTPPLSRPARFLQGTALIEVGRFRDAATLYAQLAAESATPAVLNNQAVALMRAGIKDPKASAILRRALEQDATWPDLAFNMGWALMNEGDPEAAAFWLRGVTRQEPLEPRTRLALCWALRLAKQETAANEEWKAVLVLAPSYEGLITPDLAHRYERVIASERALSIGREPRSDAEVAATLLGRADRLYDRRDYAGALRELTRAAYLDPYSARVHLLLARVRRARGEHERAVDEFRMALWSNDDAAARAELAATLKEMGRADEARTEARRALTVDPKNELAQRIVASP